MKRILLAGIATMILASPAMAADTRIGVTMALFDDNFLTNVREAIAAHAETMEDVNIQFEDAQAESEQINQVQNFVAQGLDAIIVNVADTAATQRSPTWLGRGHPAGLRQPGPDQKELPEKVAVVASNNWSRAGWRWKP